MKTAQHVSTLKLHSVSLH